MKQIFCLFLLLTTVSGCISTQKYASFVEPKTKPVAFAEQEWLVVNAPEAGQNTNSYKQLKNSFIPAILYWGWNSTIECQLAPDVTASYLKASISKAAEKYNFQSKLDGRQLVINVNEMPGRFIFVRKGFVLFLLVAYSTSSFETITPHPIDLEVTYQLLDNDTAIFEGKSQIQNQEQPLRNIWKSARKFTWLYLAEYRKETDRMAEELVEEISRKL